MKIHNVVFAVLAIFGFAAFGQTSGNPHLEKWMEGFLPVSSVASDTCITGLTFPPVSFTDSQASHQLIVHYIQDGRKLIKPYPSYTSFPTGTEGWGQDAQAALANYQSDPAYQSRSCDSARSVKTKFRRAIDYIWPTGQASAATK